MKSVKSLLMPLIFSLFLVISSVWFQGCGESNNTPSRDMIGNQTQFSFEAAPSLGATALATFQSRVSSSATLPDITPYFSYSTHFAAYYPHVSSLDFDLGLTDSGAPYSYLMCQVMFYNFNPSAALISNPDGYDSQGRAFIHFGRFDASVAGIPKVRRIEVNTAGSSSVTFQVETVCSFKDTPTGAPIITRALPSLGSENDLIAIEGRNFSSSPTVTIGGVQAAIQSSSANEIVAMVPAGGVTGMLVVDNQPGSSLQDRIGTFRVDAILEEQITASGPGPTTGKLVSALYPPGSIDANGCPTQSEVYSLFTFNFDVTSGAAVNESERAPAGAWDALIWLDPTGNSPSLKPKAGDRRITNFSNTVSIQPNQRVGVQHAFQDTYVLDCP